MQHTNHVTKKKFTCYATIFTWFTGLTIGACAHYHVTTAVVQKVQSYLAYELGPLTRFPLPHCNPSALSHEMNTLGIICVFSFTFSLLVQQCDLAPCENSKWCAFIRCCATGRASKFNFQPEELQNAFTVDFLHGGFLPVFKTLKRAVVLTIGSYSISLSATKCLSAWISLPFWALFNPKLTLQSVWAVPRLRRFLGLHVMRSLSSCHLLLELQMAIFFTSDLWVTHGSALKLFLYKGCKTFFFLDYFRNLNGTLTLFNYSAVKVHYTPRTFGKMGITIHVCTSFCRQICRTKNNKLKSRTTLLTKWNKKKRKCALIVAQATEFLCTQPREHLATCFSLKW